MKLTTNKEIMSWPDTTPINEIMDFIANLQKSGIWLSSNYLKTLSPGVITELPPGTKRLGISQPPEMAKKGEDHANQNSQ